MAPPFVSSAGVEAAELCELAGLFLDPWQREIVDVALGERPDGKWSAFEVGVEVPRQNGKGGILEALELAGLFLLGERLIIHSAHEFATAIKAFERMIALIEGCPDLAKRLKPRGGITRSHGFEGIHLRSGQSLEYRTRTKGGGRGFSCDRLILDEAMHIPEAMHSALFPTLAARENPQIIYAGSAVDQETMDNGIVFARVRQRALKGEDQRLAYFGWSPNVEHPHEVTEEMARDPQVWAQANPAFGIRISEEYIAAEQRSLGPRGFAVERLGVGDWPHPDVVKGQGLDRAAWEALEDVTSKIVGPVCFAFDVKPDRSGASIGVAGLRADGVGHVEIVESHAGTGWLVDRLVALKEKHQPLAVVCDQASPAMSLVAVLDERGVKVQTLSASEHAQACGRIFDAVQQRTLRHLGTPELNSAVRGAVKRQLGDAWAWSRKSSAVDISPLVAVTLAFSAAMVAGSSAYENDELLVV